MPVKKPNIDQAIRVSKKIINNGALNERTYSLEGVSARLDDAKGQIFLSNEHVHLTISQQQRFNLAYSSDLELIDFIEKLGIIDRSK